MEAQNAHVEQVRRLVREAFTVFEHREGSKLVDNRSLKVVIRSLGINPTESMLEPLINAMKDELMAAHEGQVNDFMPLEIFEKHVTQWYVESEAQLMRDDLHRMMRAFRAFDPEGKGYIEADVLKNAMMSHGEILNAEEANNMLAMAADNTTGRIHYEDYAYVLANDGREGHFITK